MMTVAQGLVVIPGASLRMTGEFMLHGQRVLGLIPARGGSKGIPGKNGVALAGKPLIAWTIDAARGSRQLDDVVVTTDDPGLAHIAASLGADVPFMRPVDLAQDDTPMCDTVLHALDTLLALGREYGYVVVLQPTSPLRTSDDIDAAVAMLSASDAEAVVSVTPVDHPPLWVNTLPGDGRMGDFLRSDAPTRQSLPQFFRLNGAVYVISVERLRASRRFIGDFAVAYVMPQERSVDIDTPLDLRFAEYLLTPTKP